IPGLARTSEPSGSMLATRRARFGVPDAGTFAGGVPASGTSASPDSSGTPRVLVSARDAGSAEGLGDAGGVGRPGVGPDVTGGVVRATGGGPTATRPVGRSAETRMNAAAVITATAKAVPARAKRCLRITPAAHRSGPGSGSGVGVPRRTALGRGARVRAATAAQDAVWDAVRRSLRPSLVRAPRIPPRRAVSAACLSEARYAGSTGPTI